MALLNSLIPTSSLPLPYMINRDTPSVDLSKYMMESPKKTDIKNQPTKFEFSQIPTDSSYIKLRRGNYVIMNTAKYTNWFTGFVINDPELTIVGVRNNQAVYGYKYVAMSDEYLINLKPLGIRRPFLNLTQGGILKALVDDLCPGMYDMTGIQDGILLPRYQVDPTVKFVDIVKDFCTSASFTFYGNSGQLFFIPSDTTDFSIVIDGNDKHFTPSQLTLTPTSDPIINDATILGKVEPQNHVAEYFAGDGFTGAFPLIASPFGVDSTIILQDSFSSNGLDSSRWTLYDEQASYIQVTGGYVNVLGGLANNSYGVHIDSAMPVPLEGQLRLTQGEWDFLPSNQTTNGIKGIIGGLWMQEPNGSADINTYLGCVYGLRVYQELTNGPLLLHPVVNGHADLSQFIALNTANRYVIRTNYDCALSYRTSTSTSYVDVNGSIQTVVTPDPVIHNPVNGVTSTPTNPTGISFQTLLSEIDVLSGNLVRQDIFTNEVADISQLPSYALYIPIASNDLHATFTNITISVPIQGSLQVAAAAAVGQSSIFTSPKVLPFVAQTLGQNELDSLDGQAPTATIADTNNGASTASSLLGTPQYNAGAAALTFFKNSVALQSTTPDQGSLICLKYKSAGAAVGRVSSVTSINAEASTWKDDGVRAIVRTDVSPLPRTSDECELVAAALVGGNSYQHYEGTYTFSSSYMTNNYQPISGSIIKFQNLSSQFPDVKAEEVTQVVTTLDSRRPIEYFTHVATFGYLDRVQQLLDKYFQPSDVFIPLDTTVTPISVSSSQVGLTFSPDITTFEFVGMSDGSYNYTIKEQPPVTGGFEVRLTDAGWGSDDSSNLISRFLYDPSATSYNFSVNRDSRSKVIYARSFDGRNLIPYSEDIDGWVPASCTVIQKMLPDPDDNYSPIMVITAPTGNYSTYQLYSNVSMYNSPSYGIGGYTGEYGQLTSSINYVTGQYVLTVNVKAPLNSQFVVRIADLNGTLAGQPYWFSDKNFIGTGSWQRVSSSVTLPYYSGFANIQASVLGDNRLGYGPSTLQVTRFSLEYNTPVETQYNKTSGFRYGVTSRFSSVVRVNFPFVPPPVKSISVAYSGNLTDINTVITGSGITELTSYIQQVNAAGTPTETAPTPTTPQITLTLPDEELDVFGIEIRDHDNTTVIYRNNLTTAAFSLAVSVDNPEGLADLHYYVYTYNVFGEYSTTAQILTTIFVPGLSSLTVDFDNQKLNWTVDDAINGYGAYNYKIEVDQTDGAFTSGHIVGTYYVGRQSSFDIPYAFNLYNTHTWFRVTVYNSVGSSLPTILDALFTGFSLDEFGTNEISVLIT